MDSVVPKIEARRKWVSVLTAVPVRAATLRDCRAEFLKPGRAYPVGSVLAENLADRQAVAPSVLLPNGYCMMTGRTAADPGWFPILKPHLRGWLAIPPDVRVLDAARVGIAAFRAEVEAGRLAADKCRQAVEVLERMAAEVSGRLVPGAGEAALLAGFYTWVTEAAAQSGRPQQEIVAAVSRSLRVRHVVDVPDLDPGLTQAGCNRFLDI